MEEEEEMDGSSPASTHTQQGLLVVDNAPRKLSSHELQVMGSGQAQSTNDEGGAVGRELDFDVVIAEIGDVALA